MDPGQWPSCLSRPLTICLHLWLTRKANKFSENDWLHWRDFPWKHRYKFVCFSLHERDHHHNCKLTFILAVSLPAPPALCCSSQFASQCRIFAAAHFFPFICFIWAINKASHKALTHRVGNKTNPGFSPRHNICSPLFTREAIISPSATCGQPGSSSCLAQLRPGSCSQWFSHLALHSF